MANKYIERKWFKTTDLDLIKKVLGYVNKEYATTSINVFDDKNITVQNSDIIVGLSTGNKIESLMIGIKQDNIKNTGTVNVFLTETEEKGVISIEQLNSRFLELKFIETEYKGEALTLDEKAALINKYKKTED